MKNTLNWVFFAMKIMLNFIYVRGGIVKLYFCHPLYVIEDTRRVYLFFYL